MPPSEHKCASCGLELLAAGAVCPRCTSFVDPTPIAADGTPITTVAMAPDDRYEILSPLGRGGMGIVYKVHDRELDETVALKVLEPLIGPASSAVERFKLEIKLARRINHPYVARLYDLFGYRQHLAISMEYIEGKSLERILDDGPVALPRLRRYLRYLGSALDAAHRIGVIHRDLKPLNIIVDAEDRPHILDFGIAILAGSPDPSRSKVLGTPAYMSPEQIAGPDGVDSRSDVYSLGIVLYRMATGRLPFQGEPRAVFKAHQSAVPISPRELVPAIPAALETVILRCLEKEPAKRYERALGPGLHLEELLAKEMEAAASVLRAQEVLRAPTEAPIVHAADEVPPVAVTAGMHGKVLVVDDDAAVRTVVADVLRRSRVVVVEAEDGYAGVEAALREAPDLILLDVLMPVLDGREALRILKSNKKTAAIPVVMLTGMSDPDESVLSKETGAAKCLNKPIHFDVLELLVEKYVHGARKD